MNKEQALKLIDELKAFVEKLEDKKPDGFTYEKFIKFYKGTQYEAGATECFNNISKALKDESIYSDNTLIGALATVRVEVGKNFKPIMEYASGQDYEGRISLGNTQKGDGVRFKGRGYIQITGRTNYTNYGKALGVDLVNNPDLALQPELSARILARYFRDRGIDTYCNNENWTKVRQLVNGGTNGLQDFLRVVGEYKNAKAI